MIEYRKNESIFDSGAQALVNPVNTAGVMGKGLALEFKRRYPDNFLAYTDICKQNMLRGGEVFVFGRKPLVFNAATKRHWRNPSDLRDIKLCLFNIRSEIYERDIQSIAIPALGCGLGGLIWSDVRSMLECVLGDVAAHILVYEP